MLLSRRVLITGIGAITPYGVGTAPLRDGLLEGRSAIRGIRAFDAGRFATRIGGEAPPVELTEHFDERELSWLSRLSAFAVIAAREAIADAGASLPGERTGVLFGTGFASLPESAGPYLRWAREGDVAARPNTIPTLMVNAPSAQIAMRLGLRGPNMTLSTACASGSHALGQAFLEIREGRAEAMVAGGGDLALTELMLLCWSRMRILSKRNDEPERACRPFDADRDGLVLSEAAVMLVLESEASVRRRGARAYAELAGYAANSDASHLTAPVADSEAIAMREALRAAGVEPREVGFISAHGTATRANDRTEAEAIHRVFGRDGVPRVSAVKSMIGHTMGASGAIGVASTALAFRDDRLPPTLNLETPDPQCALPIVTAPGERPERAAAIVNAFAFGGHNAVLVLRRA